MSSALQRLQRYTSTWLSRPGVAIPSATGPRYSRIRVQKPEDFERLYPLILRFSQYPEEAASVREFVFQVEFKQESCFGNPSKAKLDEWKARESQRRISETEDQAIFEAIKPLGLEGAERQEWAKILTWMKPGYLTERISTRRSNGESEFWSYFGSRDSIFAYHAAAVLLMLCPNIETFVYEDNFYYAPENTVSDTMCRNNYGLLPKQHLQNLRHVQILSTTNIILGDERFYTKMNLLGLLRMFHRLPSIESVSIDAIQPDDAGDYESLFPPGTSNLRSLKIGHSMMPSNIIATLIRVPNQLEEFEFSTGGRASSDSSFYTVYPKTIGKALFCHRTTLRKLDLDLDEHLSFADPRHGHPNDEDHPGDDEEEGWDTHAFWDQDKKEMRTPLYTLELVDPRDFGATIGSFRDFPSLTHLSIGIQLLLGPRPQMQMYRHFPLEEAPFRLIDSLPVSLEYLLIRGYTKGKDAHFDSQIQEFMALRQERLPNLQVVEGIDESVPSGESIDRPDEHPDLLWEMPDVPNDWVEVDEV